MLVIFAALGIYVLALFWTVFVIFASCNFWKSPFYCRYNAEFSFGTNKNLKFLRLFLENLVGYFCINMSAGSPQFRVRQREIWQP